MTKGNSNARDRCRFIRNELQDIYDFCSLFGNPTIGPYSPTWVDGIAGKFPATKAADRNPARHRWVSHLLLLSLQIAQIPGAQESDGVK